MEPDDLVRDARAEQDDPVADVLRGKVRKNLFGVEPAATKLGRFTVLETVGSGAMGTVFAAYDPVLDRKVAIKLLRETGDGAKGRLLEEARALAKLVHPNVVTVHEADTVEDRVYIAMEFVGGSDFRVWLAAQKRDWREVVAVMGAAARGLAAAHAAGVVHGDFKPENLLVGENVVRVADFGGGGTPFYMPPERLRGAAATDASDQFAFGVTLFEALFGHRPWEGDTVTELADAMKAAPRLPSESKIPTWLCTLALKAVALRPTERHASMDSIADELTRRRSNPLVGPVVFGAVALGSVGVAAAFGGPRDQCSGGEQQAAQAWDESRAKAMHESFVASGHSFAKAAARRVESSLSEYTRAWAAEHRRVCEATRVHGDQSDSMYDLRMRCLDRRLSRLRALADSFGTIDKGASIADAVNAAAALPGFERCRADAVGDAEFARPDGAALGEEVDAARERIDDAWARYYTARYDEAAVVATATLTEAERIGFDPLTAEALYLQGSVEARSGDAAEAEATLRRAMIAASGVRNDRLAADAIERLLRTKMINGEDARVLELADFARSSALLAGEDPDRLEGIVGEAHLGAGDPRSAVLAFERALEAEPRADRVAILEMNLGSARLALGDTAAALEQYEKALQTASGHLGEAHPSVGFFLQRLGRGQRAAGDLDTAHATLRRALSLREVALGPNDRAIASTLADLARVELERNDLESAREHLERALKIRRAAYSEDHPRLVALYLGLGDVAHAQGRREDAVSAYSRALEIRSAVSPTHPQLAEIRARLSGVQP